VTTIDQNEIRSALAEILPRREAGDAKLIALGIGTDDHSSARAYLEQAARGGWAVPTWPKEFGGRDASPEEAREITRILEEEFVGPDLYAFSAGIRLVGPCLLQWGTPEQRKLWLRPIADGSEIWCQLFSEPEAGSDLAGVRTRAELDGDTWLLHGQKVWTSRATWSRWGICLARTDPDVPKHEGLTMFAVDMEAEGVEIRPLRQMNGDDHFSEVFLHRVRVPDAHRLGPPGEGWHVTRSILAAEHQFAGTLAAAPVSWEVPAWLQDLADRGVLDDPVRRDLAMRAYCLDVTVALTLAGAADWATTGLPSSGGSGGKLREVERFKTVAYLVKDSYGPTGLLEDHDGHLDFLTAPSMSIRGGTDEIQRNIVGERSLGLPSEPRPPKGQPWSQSEGVGS
jgi:alkylation response protein AidB-like acyl-CoA dehydrogenase